MLVHTDKYSGLGEWVYETEAALTDEERERHILVMIGLHYASRPQQAWSSFPAFIDHLEALPAPELRDRILRKYHSLPTLKDGEAKAPFNAEAILRSEEDYMAYLAQRFPETVVQNPIEQQAYRYLIDPPALQAAGDLPLEINVGSVPREGVGRKCNGRKCFCGSFPQGRLHLDEQGRRPDIFQWAAR